MAVQTPSPRSPLPALALPAQGPSQAFPAEDPGSGTAGPRFLGPLRWGLGTAILRSGCLSASRRFWPVTLSFLMGRRALSAGVLPHLPAWSAAVAHGAKDAGETEEGSPPNRGGPFP